MFCSLPIEGDAVRSQQEAGHHHQYVKAYCMTVRHCECDGLVYAFFAVYILCCGQIGYFC